MVIVVFLDGHRHYGYCHCCHYCYLQVALLASVSIVIVTLQQELSFQGTGVDRMSGTDMAHSSPAC